ncbi:hypothetical protein HK101_008806 [Irineochytrium annulatum]|nr:hypothetical protein HK101_008806 [Irineochytrium annulatum]
MTGFPLMVGVADTIAIDSTTFTGWDVDPPTAAVVVNLGTRQLDPAALEIPVSEKRAVEAVVDASVDPGPSKPMTGSHVDTTSPTSQPSLSATTTVSPNSSTYTSSFSISTPNVFETLTTLRTLELGILIPLAVILVLFLSFLACCLVSRWRSKRRLSASPFVTNPLFAPPPGSSRHRSVVVESPHLGSIPALGGGRRPVIVKSTMRFVGARPGAAPPVDGKAVQDGEAPYAAPKTARTRTISISSSPPDSLERLAEISANAGPIPPVPAATSANAKIMRRSSSISAPPPTPSTDPAQPFSAYHPTRCPSNLYTPTTTGDADAPDSASSSCTSISTVSTSPPESEFRYVVAVPWVPQRSDELALRVGEGVIVYRVYEDGWCDGRREEGEGEEGVFPMACLRGRAWSFFGMLEDGAVGGAAGVAGISNGRNATREEQREGDGVAEMESVEGLGESVEDLAVDVEEARLSEVERQRAEEGSVSVKVNVDRGQQKDAGNQEEGVNARGRDMDGDSRV